MRVTRLGLRDFRNYARAEVELGPGLTVVCGPNGAGKTNLLEGLYFGLTGRSCRTSNEREVVRTGATLTRVTAATADEDGEHLIEVGHEPGEAKRLRVDGALVERLSDSPVRPLVSVFLPDRLELVKGAPAGRRAHIDHFVAALWPARAETRGLYGRAMAQRNAQLTRIRAGVSGAGQLDTWDAELARHGVQLMADRAAAVEELAPRFARLAEELGLPTPAELSYRPRSWAADAEALRLELAERRDDDLTRGFTTHGPHRDDLALRLAGRSLRSYGSQGQQRQSLLALLFAERELLAERGRPPLMLLDDVMSELDAERRRLLTELVRAGGQALITATEPEHVPGAGEHDVPLLWVEGGNVSPTAAAAA
jgi:DNA replication and repair protein RecF